MASLTDKLKVAPSQSFPPKSGLSTPQTDPDLTFPLFPALPAELRLKIWKLTMSTTSRILKISYSLDTNTYISNTAPPVLLSVASETRDLGLESYTYLKIGRTPYAAIPFDPSTDILYISKLAPILQIHLPDLLYNLSTSPSRNAIRKIAIDLRVWNECCEKGLLGVLGHMKELKRACIVVEFGRQFKGEIDFLEAPEWRSDLRWVAEMAERVVAEDVGRARGKVGEQLKERPVKVGCVLLTRGGEQA